MSTPKWLDIARRELGVSEKPGKLHNARILAYFAAAGHPRVVDDETAWCAAFINFCLVSANLKGTMSLAARSFVSWGKRCKPQPGAVAIWRRGKLSWQGHANIVEKIDGLYAVCIGGNQNNSVNRQRYLISDAVDFRWPPTVGNSRTMAAMLSGSASTGTSIALESGLGNFVLEQAQEAQMLTYNLQEFVSWAPVATGVLSLLCFALGAWFRWKDMKEKGR